MKSVAEDQSRLRCPSAVGATGGCDGVHRQGLCPPASGDVCVLVPCRGCRERSGAALGAALSAHQTQHGAKMVRKRCPLCCKYLDSFQWLGAAGGSLEAGGAALMWLLAGAGWSLVPGGMALVAPWGGGAGGATERVLSAPPPRRALRPVVWDSGQW